MEISNAGKLPALNSVNAQQTGVQPTQVELKQTAGNQYGNNGLANMFANTGQKVENGNVQGQQGLAGMLGSYRSMWQPNSGNNYQVVGGVGNII